MGSMRGGEFEIAPLRNIVQQRAALVHTQMQIDQISGAAMSLNVFLRSGSATHPVGAPHRW